MRAATVASESDDVERAFQESLDRASSSSSSSSSLTSSSSSSSSSTEDLFESFALEAVAKSDKPLLRVVYHEEQLPLSSIVAGAPLLAKKAVINAAFCEVCAKKYYKQRR